ncbi:hypothetical protein STEG23_028235 [Scotinomys teguina]
MLRMVLEALQAREKRQGTSVVAIKLYIQHKYPTVDVTRFKYLLKQALDTGMRRGLLTRPANSKARGATGSFKLVPKHKKKRTCSSIARRGATDAKKTGPKKPTELKTDQASKGKIEKEVLKPEQRRKTYSCPAATSEKAPKKASKAKLGEVRKAPLKSDKATPTPPTASKIGQKVRHNGSRQGTASYPNRDPLKLMGKTAGLGHMNFSCPEAHRKTKDVCEKLEPSASKVQNSVTSLDKRKMAVMAHNETVAQGARIVHKTKAPAPPQDIRNKVQPTHRVRRTKTPENSKRPGLPPKTSSKAHSKKAEAGS